MNRFIPDDWLEALLRPLAMALPKGWIYLEVIAPDMRFVFMALLVLVSVLLARKSGTVRPVLAVLVVLLAVSFVPWLMTSGNGRYFIPMLVLVGIVCVALAHSLPVTRSARATLVLLMVFMQAFAVLQNHPWKPGSAWGMYDWREAPYYPLLLDAEARAEPATYVTLSVISYSLIAPQFPADSRWINMSSLLGVDEDTPDLRRAKAMLSSAQRLRVVLPAATMPVQPDGRPLREALPQVERLMLQQHLRFAQAPGRCRLQRMRPSRDDGTASVQARGLADEQPGFWICDAAYVDKLPIQEQVDPRRARVFDVLERSCPRLFPAGQKQPVRTADGLMRHYGSADMKVFVFDDGRVFYKYHRSLNMVLLGTVDNVLASGFRMRCDQVPGRGGLPWEREF